MNEMFTKKDIDQMIYWNSVEYKWKRIDPRNIFIWENSVKIIDFDEKGNKYSETFDY